MLASSLETASLDGNGWKNTGSGPGSRAGEFIEWLTIQDQRQSIVDDVARIKSHPLVPKGIPVYGYLYDVSSGRLIEVPEATAAGRS